MNSEKSSPPFEGLSEIRASGGGFDVKEIEKDPTLVVKEFRFGAIYTRENLHAVARDMNLMSKLIAGGRVSEYIPYNRVVEGADENGQATIYLVSDKIQGETLSQDSSLSTDEKKYLIDFVDAALDIYEQTYDKDEKKGLALEFDKPTNYIRGVNLRNNKGEKIYLIDTYPAFPDTPDALLQRFANFLKKFNIQEEEVGSVVDRIHKLTQ